MLTYRQSTPEDVDALARVEAESWPETLAASRDAVASRVALFAAGQWVAELDGRIVGAAFAQRVPVELMQAADPSFDRITNHGTFERTHDPDGAVYQLVGVGVAGAGQGLGAGRRLIDCQLAFARRLPGVERVVGFTRPVRFHRFPDLSIDEYVSRQSRSGRIADPVLSFHLDYGARLVSVHPDFRPNDWESRGYGVLIEYPCR